MSFFERGSTYQTAYGKARVLRIVGDELAVFGILEPSEEALKGGYRKNDTFRAHPDDGGAGITDAPFPRSWQKI